ncbi:oxysterol-binding protein-related protein 5 isoform X2 [Stigmatopora nigra]
MKEESLYRRRLSLCPNVASPPPPIDTRALTRNLSYGGDNDLSNLSSGSETDRRDVSAVTDELSPAQSPGSKSEGGMFNGLEKDGASPTEKLARKESLKVQKQNYREEKKRAAKELFSALKDPSVVITSNWLKIRGSWKSWTKLWCVLKPGVLLIYKSPKSEQWVGTVLLGACELIERPSKKDGFCFKLYHPLEKSIWAVKGPKGENVGAITQPLPGNYLIFRASSESDGRCWMDALELALSCSSLYKLTSKSGKDGDVGAASESSHFLHLLQSAALADAELLQLNESGLLESDQAEQDALSDKWERDDWDVPLADNGSRLTEEESDPSDEALSPDGRPALYVEQGAEEMAEAGEASQVETVSEENKGLIWGILKQLRPGMDLSKVVLPTFILEPRSFLDKLSDYYYHADLLSQAAREESAYGRMKQVVCWYLSGFYKKPKGLKKPYNPILGETFRCCWPHPQSRSCTFYVAEQVSHHPPISTFYVCNRKDGFSVSGSILAKSKFYGNSLSAILDGKARLLFPSRDEEYVITMPYAHCKGLLYGTMTLELGGKVTICCHKTKCFTELEFKLKPFLGGPSSVNQISGKISVCDELAATVDGHWDGEVFIQEKHSGQRSTLWNPGPDVRAARLKRRVVRLDQQGEFESERLWQHVTRAIVERDQVRATHEKFVLEEAQRKESRERGERAWTPRLFYRDPVADDWTYKCDRTLGQQSERDGVPRAAEKGRRPQANVKGARRKASHNTESSGSTPEPRHESSDDEELSKPCAQCRSTAVLQASIATIHHTQQDIQRNLWALARQLDAQRAGGPAPDGGGGGATAAWLSRHCAAVALVLLSHLLLRFFFYA